MSRHAVLVFALAGATVLVAAGHDAAAQPTADDAAAETLFDEAVALRNAGDRAGACARFRRSYQLAPARGTLLNIAECFEAEGMRASAWATYRTLADQAEAHDDHQRLVIARAKRAELEPRLAHVTIVVTDPPAGLMVQRDETTLPPDGTGEPVPIDAGAHTITVTAPGHQPWTTRLEVVDGTRRRLDVPALVPMPVAVPLPPAAATSTPATTTRRHPRATTGLAMLGAGAVGAAVGFGFGAAAWRAERDAAPTCDANLVCDTYGYDRLQDARTSARRADLLLGISGALAVTGAVLWWTAPDGAEVRITPIAGRDVVGVALGGRL